MPRSHYPGGGTRLWTLGGIRVCERYEARLGSQCRFSSVGRATDL
jgi:hypothetical protein